jgi:hypothetical protein
MPLRAALVRVFLVSVFVAVVLTPAALFAQSPELSLREFASGQIKKGVRSIGFGGDGATGGNYALVSEQTSTQDQVERLARAFRVLV